MQVIALNDQSIFDIAIRESKTVMAAFDWILENDISITDDLAPGQKLQSIVLKEYEAVDLTFLIQELNKRNEIVTILDKQTLFDISTQKDGNTLATFDWAFENNVSVTDELFVGNQLKMPKSETFFLEDFANYFKDKNQLIATDHILENAMLPIQPEGIGAMIIQTNFIVA